MSNSHRPVQAPPPFPEPILLSARRTTGTVLTPLHGGEEAAVVPPPSLDRKASIAGNILIIQDTQAPKAKQTAILLQRKIKDSLHGSVRVGFVLCHPNESETGAWELKDDSDARHEMVAVKIKSRSKSIGKDPPPSLLNSYDRLNELSALQWITANDPEGKGHLLGPTILASDEGNIYMVTPYHKEGTLYDYCDTKGTLSEPEARFFFRQMLEGLENLKGLEVCHRSLSLDCVLLRGASCTFAHLVHALRIPCSDDGMVLLIEPQVPCGANPQSIAPELLNNEAFDGGVVDLWSTGVMLFAMLLGYETLFDAPIPEDKRFKEICIRGNLKAYAPETLSDSAIDLLQGMLQAAPRDRLSLEAVKAHPWVTVEEVTLPGKMDSFKESSND